MKWVKVTVRTAPAAAEGVLEVMNTYAGGAVQSDSSALTALHAYAPAAKARGLMKHLRARLKALGQSGIPTRGTRVTSRPVVQENWERSWQRDFPVQRFSSGLVVAPPWERYAGPPGETVVIIQPSLAFGTGQHDTTRMCLTALQRFVKRGDAIADVGCGSGILAIAALKMGASVAWAIDNDPLALKAAAENARRNRVEKRLIVRKANLLDGVRRKFHLIVANLTAEQLVQLAPGAANRLHPGGVFIGSGVVKGKVAIVKPAMVSAGLEPVQVHRAAQWRTVICTNRDKRAS